MRVEAAGNSLNNGRSSCETCIVISQLKSSVFLKLDSAVGPPEDVVKMQILIQLVRGELKFLIHNRLLSKSPTSCWSMKHFLIVSRRTDLGHGSWTGRYNQAADTEASLSLSQFCSISSPSFCKNSTCIQQ